MREEKQLVPKLRFPEFDGNWETMLFDNLFIFSSGKNIKQSEASPDFEIPCVRYGELYHMYSEVITEIINKTNLDKSELVFSNGDEILLPSAGEDPLDIGSASALLLKNIAIGRTINILRPKRKNYYSHSFISYYINQKLKKKIATLAKGVSISNVYNSDLKKLKINLPILTEQQKIANFLTAVDVRLQTLEKKKSLLEQYKKGVMQQIFSQEIRFKPALSGVEGDDNESDFPEWEEKKLGEFLTIPIKESPDTIDTNKILTVKLHLKGISVNERTDGLKIGSTKYIMRRQGQFIYGKQNLFNGAFGIIPSKFDGYYSSGDVPALDVRNINPSFLLHFFSRKSFYRRLEKIASGSGSKRIHENNLMSQNIIVPSLEEQQKIAQFLTAIDTQIATVNHQLEHTKTYKKGLLQQLFV